MEINVSQLLKQPVGATRVYQVDEDVKGIEESGASSHVSGDLRLLRTGSGILVHATLETTVKSTCSRCLEPVSCDLKLQIEEEYFPSVDINTGYPVEIPGDSTGFTIDANHILSLDEAIRQYVLLNQPMQPLCQADCVGLCPDCGANLNVEQCECHLQSKGSPFADLGRVLDATGDPTANDERS